MKDIRSDPEIIGKIERIESGLPVEPPVRSQEEQRVPIRQEGQETQARKVR
jgi:hypothetical protein